jgi:epoxide hydrolase-like predicted phosphatase
MIRAIIFDVGGVLVRTVDKQSRRSLEKRLELADGEAEALVFNSAMGQAAQRGEIADEALWAWVGQRFSLSPQQLSEFRHSFWGGDVLDTELIALIRVLRARYQTAVISNATDALRRTLTEKYPVADAFDLIVGSAEEGIMKPDPDIYLRTLDRLGRKPAETVFIDDFAHNVAAARELGLHTIHYKPGLDIAGELSRLGVN